MGNFATNPELNTISQSADTSKNGMATFGLDGTASLAAGGGYDPNKVINDILKGPLSTNTDKLTALGMQNYLNGENQTFLGMDKGTLSGLQGIAGIGSSLAGLYFDYQNNKRADEVLGMQKQEYNRGVKKDQDFSLAMGASGLGTYSAGSTAVPTPRIG